MKDFVHLHLHTQYSLLDGAIKIQELFNRLKELRQSAVAITDHGNLFGAVHFFQAAKEAGIKPIIGCEVYVAHGSRFDKKAPRGGVDASYHLTLLAKDEEGYKNLVKLVSYAYLEGFYYKPRIDKELLSAFSKGLIALSGCVKGEIPQLILKDDLDKAKEVAREYASILGEDNFYIEIMRVGIDEEVKLNSGLIEVARELGIPVVATNDCHYIYKDDVKLHDVLICIQTGKRLDDENRLKVETDQLYVKSSDEMYELFSDIPEALANSVAISEKCNFEFKFGKTLLPVYDVPKGYTLESYLRELAFNGLESRYKNGELSDDIPFEKYIERLEYELSVIEKLKFSGYFLIVWDFVNFAKSKGIPVGPGRGSAAGSIVSYSLGITDIDPLRWGLLFERFLNPERVNMPDIDIDFCMDRREEVISYVKRKYGEKNVAKIITYNKLAPRAAVRDVGRVMGFTPKEVDRIAKMIPAYPGATFEDILKLEPKIVEEMEKDERVKSLIEMAIRVEGFYRHAGTHAAGIVITPGELTDYVPLYRSEKEGEIATQYDKDVLEALGLLKMDLLGLKTLTVIDMTLRLIKIYRQKDINLKDIPLNDERTYELLRSGMTRGVFQLESSGMRDLVRRLKPSRFEDLIALVALYRPGPLGSGMVDEFIDRKHGKKKIDYFLPQLEPILSETYGVILYQEQVMKIASEIAGFTLAQADLLRKAMGKKLKDVMQKQRENFIKGAVANGISKEDAEKLFDMMEEFAKYGFNKSHSAAYALIAYHTAYLKAHYPVEFMAALISSEVKRPEKIYVYLNECRELGVKIEPPDINESEVIFSVSESALRFGLAAIKGVGEAAAEVIVKERKRKKYKSFYDFCRRVVGNKVNKKTVEALVKAGAFDSLHPNRKALLEIIDYAVDSSFRMQKSRDKRQISLFDIADVDEGFKEEYPDVDPPTAKEILSMEKEALGFYLTGHPLDIYSDMIEALKVDTVSSLELKGEGEETIFAGMVVSIKEILTKNAERMAFVSLEDKEGRVEVVIFPDLYKDVDMLLMMDEPIVIKGTLSVDVETGNKKIIASEVALLKDGFKIKRGVCMIEIKDTAKVDMGLIKELAMRYKGDVKLLFKVCNSEYEVLIDSGERVSEEFIRDVKKIGDIKVKIVEDRNGVAA